MASARNTTTAEIEAQLEASEDEVNAEIRAMHGGEEYFLSPLMSFAQMRNVDMVKTLIEMGADPNMVIVRGKTRGMTALHTAAHKGDSNLPVVEILLEAGARADMQDQNGETALYQSVQDSSVQIAIAILSRATPDVSFLTKSGHSALYVAVERGNKTILDALIKYGRNLNINQKHAGGRTALHVAAFKQPHLVETILAVPGVEVDQVEDTGSAALSFAAQIGATQAMERLIAQGSAVNHRNSVGLSAIYVASHSEFKAVALLIKSGADVNISNDKGHGPLHAAASSGQLNICKLLVEHGADINRSGSLDGLTPIQVAAMEGWRDVVDYLMKKGAEFDARGTVAKACKCCEATGVALKRCSGCSTVYYCSPECQKKDWKEGHKVQCARLREQRNEFQDRMMREIDDSVAALCSCCQGKRCLRMMGVNLDGGPSPSNDE